MGKMVVNGQGILALLTTPPLIFSEGGGCRWYNLNDDQIVINDYLR